MMAGPSALTVQRSAAMYRHFLLHRGALECMVGGVMTVDSDGRIGIFNNAASRLLGLAPAEVQWKLFAEVFLVREGLEEFTDTVLAAIHDEAVGARSTVRVRVTDGTVRSLSVTTSYLVRRKDGESLKAGVVAVFDDLTEIETLREAERRLMESTRAQNAELRDAYREIEDKNRALDAAARKMQLVRTAAMVLIFALFLGAAWYVWDETGAALREQIAGTPGVPSGASESAITATVAPRRLTMTLSFVGRLVPRREVRVTSPTAGRVARVLFEYGDRVVAGQPLVELDTAEVKQRYRTARAEYLDARDRLREIENWENSPEMSRRRRAVARAAMELEARESKLAETALLLDTGIIPASEHAAAERRYNTQRLSHTAAVQDLESARAKANANALQIARLKLENAEARMGELERTLESVTISAPVSGIVLPPATRGGEGSSEPLAAGRSVNQGGYLLSVGDLEGLAVAGRIDEVDVMKVRPGQRVRISGDAFPDLDLEGKIARVSPQSQRGGAGRVPTFGVIATIDRLADAHRERLRLGMSANVVVVVRDEPAALLVPLAAVRGEPGKNWLHVRSAEDDTVRRVPVEVGATTLNEAEIVRGLEAGDEVIVSG